MISNSALKNQLLAQMMGQGFQGKTSESNNVNLPDLDEMMASVEDPKLKMLYNFMKLKSTGASGIKENYIKPEQKSAARHVKVCLTKIQELEERENMLNARLSFSNDMLTRLASALGACTCFGTDAHCSSCGGHGKAGFTAYDPLAFNEFVMPLMHKISEADQADDNEQTQSAEKKTSSQSEILH
jgi:hypothetical protein